MLSTIAFVTIFASIIVFFRNELSTYIKNLVAKPYAFLVFAMVLSSAFLEMYEPKLLWLMMALWVGLLIAVQWLSQHLFFIPMADFLSKLIVVIVLSSIPNIISYFIDKNYKKRYFNSPKKSRKRSYMVGLFLWVILILLFALGPPGSDFSG